MISVTEFNKQFIERHELEYDDLDLLPNKYPNILFKDIPQAWVCCIYDSLYSMKDLSKIVSISQIFGFPVIQYENDIRDVEFKILKDLEHDLLSIDMDLHNQLDAITLN
jgi:hypothetical protein